MHVGRGRSVFLSAALLSLSLCLSVSLNALLSNSLPPVRVRVFLWNSPDVEKTFPVYEEVEGLQVLPRSEEFSEKFAVSGGGGGGSGSLVAVAGKNGVVRVFALEGALGDAARGVDEQAGAKSKKRKKNKTAAAAAGSDDGDGDKTGQQPRLTCRCVMTQDNASASHRAGYTSLLLDPRRGGLLAVTSDHNLVLLEAVASAAAAAAGKPGAVGSLVTRRQIVGYNDEVIDLKSFPSGAGCGGEDGESWVAVATNSPQVRLFELGGFSCRLLDGHTDTVLALDVAPDG